MPFGIFLQDHRFGALDDFGCRAVILSQPDLPDIWKILEKPFEAAGIGSPEAIDGLVGIPDYKNPRAVFAPLLDQAVLHRVDILKLVHQKMGKSVPERIIRHTAHVCVLKQPEHVEQDIIVIQNTITIKLSAVQIIYPGGDVRFFPRGLRAAFYQGNSSQNLPRGIFQMQAL